MGSFWGAVLKALGKWVRFAHFFEGGAAGMTGAVRPNGFVSRIFFRERAAARQRDGCMRMGSFSEALLRALSKWVRFTHFLFRQRDSGDPRVLAPTTWSHGSAAG